MKVASLLLSALSAAALATEATTTTSCKYPGCGTIYPCLAHPTKVSKLRECSTATAFCHKYLHGSATFTRTRYTRIPVPTTTSTETTTSTYQALSTFTFSTTSTFTYAKYSPACVVARDAPAAADAPQHAQRAAVVTPAVRRGILPLFPRKSASCGLKSTADPSKVSQACQCILAKETTKTFYGTYTTSTMSITTSTTTVPVPPSTTLTQVVTSTMCTDNIYDSNFLIRVPPGSTQSDADGAYLKRSFQGGATFINVEGTFSDSAAIVWAFRPAPNSAAFYPVPVLNPSYASIYCLGFQGGCELSPNAIDASFACTVDAATKILTCVKDGSTTAETFYFFTSGGSGVDGATLLDGRTPGRPTSDYTPQLVLGLADPSS